MISSTALFTSQASGIVQKPILSHSIGWCRYQFHFTEADGFHGALQILRRFLKLGEGEPPVGRVHVEHEVHRLTRIDLGANVLDELLKLGIGSKGLSQPQRQDCNQARGKHYGSHEHSNLPGFISTGPFVVAVFGPRRGSPHRCRTRTTRSSPGNFIPVDFTFSGKVSGETMSGDLDMGEYLKAVWSAKKHQYPERPA